MTEQRKNRIRALLQRREHAATMAKIRRIFGIGFALLLVLIVLAIVVL